MKREKLLKNFQRVRKASIDMCSPLQPEQCRIQSSPDVSPPWWNLAHSSWFFNRNVLSPFGGKSAKEDNLFDYVLNSYYASLGPRLERHRRGLMTRPTMAEVYQYRESVDARVEELIMKANNKTFEQFEPVIDIGIQHEQQHQELFYTEIKHILYQNPLKLRQPYQLCKKAKNATSAVPSKFLTIEGGLQQFGNLEGGWEWDNEKPIHQYFIESFQLQNRLVTNAEYLEFMEDGGYKDQLLWLDNGWNRSQEQGWEAPFYWELIDGKWLMWTLSGMREVDMAEPVCHVSFYEADAFSKWKGLRLPSEREWELAARQYELKIDGGNFLSSGLLHPARTSSKTGLSQMLGDVWEWTTSYFEPYPGYVPFDGNLREYNEKFMDNQRVMRGGSCVSEPDHIRISYRNFWPPETRFQFTGIRLAKD